MKLLTLAAIAATTYYALQGLEVPGLRRELADARHDAEISEALAEGLLRRTLKERHTRLRTELEAHERGR